MARKFTTALIAQAIEGTDPVISSVQHADLLGSADELVFQVTTTQVSTQQANAQLTLKYSHSNDGQGFASKSNNVFTTVNLSNNLTLMSDPVAGNGAYGQIEVTLADASDKAFVRVIACGRVD